MLVTYYFASLLAACMALASSSGVQRRGNSGISANGGGLSGSGPNLQIGRRATPIRGGDIPNGGSKARNTPLVVSPLLLSSSAIILGLFAWTF
ncbi:hypothetical protein Pst134EA_000447 [Puccinia striiformis f. sp. tritici]|uniref:Uncharacterized protein n=3 Tax=Puccinia striiformis TaxID=27350 RepID=A0A0L0VPA7_9BASI|nr:hypothetical protein Pst134EA_000430 [Puccinia striiformis f. sp. tritici]XP_047812828.1 hypothetical protein Pst134EA_000447 [Puccinia striiformis f. sp. tritici]KAH9473358.1 hypothetical protein Pst134EA_000430 [Puccinia striiformis f. sp. tritici]KAH9473374.1 hypothetical protein Pst134EA_000447 [Puccinia striiformis f. sp. tritici]KNF01027.1 hypothetical protein PSTG_05660 [Puccinia striiformis f. sp. tritici PST-78]